jgi:zinc D-Ala-D-Ala dipeptidase
MPTGNAWPVLVGSNGLGWDDDQQAAPFNAPVKREGDGRAPAGIFALGSAFGYADQPLPGLRLPYITLHSTIECVDDPKSSRYNTLINHCVTADVDWKSSEHMRLTDHDTSDDRYRWGVVVAYNTTPARPHRGSCIFLHIAGPQNTRGTAGCTVMEEAHLREILTWLDPQKSPHLVQLPIPEYARLQTVWGLPTLTDHIDTPN